MFDRSMAGIERAPVWLVSGAGMALVTGIGIADYLTGAQLSLSVFYLLPIGLVAWRAGRIWPYSFSLVSALAWYVANLPGSLQMGFSQATLVWNTSTRLGFFLIVSALIGSLRSVLELERARRYEHPLSMVYLDLDGFKQLNDQHGHAAGDRTLQVVAGLLAANVRANDLVARLGGDEFGVVLAEADAEAAQAAGAKLQRQILHGLTDGAGAHAVGLCMGVVTCLRAPGSVDQLVGLADQLMYAAKRSGGSRLVHQVLGPESIQDETNRSDPSTEVPEW